MSHFLGPEDYDGDDPYSRLDDEPHSPGYATIAFVVLLCIAAFVLGRFS